MRQCVRQCVCNVVGSSVLGDQTECDLLVCRERERERERERDRERERVDPFET